VSSRPCKHPGLVASCCRLYGLMTWMYPASLRREYRREMLLIFKNTAQDVLDEGSVLSVILFVIHTAVDWLRTLALERDQPATMSLLGLSSTESRGAGCIDSSSVTVSFMLATLGVVLLIAGWYEWLHLHAVIVSYHHIA